MSLENNIQRIADALELIAGHLTSQAVNEVAEKKTRAPRSDKQTVQATGADIPPTPPVQTPPLAGETLVQPLVTPPPAAPVSAPPVVDIVVAPPPAAAAPVVTMTPTELNDALVVEYHRLGGNRDAIVEEMAKFGVTSVNDLPVDKYQPLLDAVKARTK